MSSDIQKLTKLFIKFRNDRDWQRFHKPKDVALSLTLEAAEFLELFQWKTDDEALAYFREHPEKFRDELADIFGWVLILSHDLGIDLAEAVRAKVVKNELKYPLDKSRGISKKYTEL